MSSQWLVYTLLFFGLFALALLVQCRRRRKS
jgi:MYXO-CTERM domain-containing protein